MQKAQAAYGRLPWLYEARALEAQAYIALGRLQEREGRTERAVERYREAEAAYEGALEIARSAPSISEGLCNLGAP